MIPGALAAVAAVAVIGYVVALSLGRSPSRELLTIAVIALFASCTTASHELPKGSLVNIEVAR